MIRKYLLLLLSLACLPAEYLVIASEGEQPVATPEPGSPDEEDPDVSDTSERSEEAAVSPMPEEEEDLLEEAQENWWWDKVRSLRPSALRERATLRKLEHEARKEVAAANGPRDKLYTTALFHRNFFKKHGTRGYVKKGKNYAESLKAWWQAKSSAPVPADDDRNDLRAARLEEGMPQWLLEYLEVADMPVRVLSGQAAHLLNMPSVAQPHLFSDALLAQHYQPVLVFLNLLLAIYGIYESGQQVTNLLGFVLKGLLISIPVGLAWLVHEACFWHGFPIWFCLLSSGITFLITLNKVRTYLEGRKARPAPIRRPHAEPPYAQSWEPVYQEESTPSLLSRLSSMISFLTRRSETNP